ncbi:uncharacterized protein LOC143617207 [Bidens hawaiensis]|uniref:uncharacterized protein LOC143617207 n=1 Tax=Bidens hawaiensis TaxID=980011 RepID=UPI00404AFC5E
MSVVTTGAQSEGSGGMPFQCLILTSTNYNSWAIKMEAIMDAQGVWEAVNPPAGGAVDDKKNKMARAFIFQATLEVVLLQVAKNKTAKEVWDSLKNRYLGADRVQQARVATLKREIDSLRMKEGETVDEFTGKLSELVSKLNSLGTIMEEGVLVRKLLDSMPDNYLQLVASIEQCLNLDTMPFDEAIGRMKAYEERIRRKNTTGDTQSKLFLTQLEPKGKQKSVSHDSYREGHGRGQGWSGSDSRGRGRGRGRGFGRGRGGREGSNQNQKGRTWNRDKSHIKCFECNEF